MTTHLHDLPEWPFEDAQNTACFTCNHILEAGHPILRVTHDDEDGAWQFLCGLSHDLDQARIVCLGCMVVRDKQLLALSDLPLGWCAQRSGVGSSWIRERNPTEPV